MHRGRYECLCTNNTYNSSQNSRDMQLTTTKGTKQIIHWDVHRQSKIGCRCLTGQYNSHHSCAVCVPIYSIYVEALFTIQSFTLFCCVVGNGCWSRLSLRCLSFVSTGCLVLWCRGMLCSRLTVDAMMKNSSRLSCYQ